MVILPNLILYLLVGYNFEYQAKDYFITFYQ